MLIVSSAGFTLGPFCIIMAISNCCISIFVRSGRGKKLKAIPRGSRKRPCDQLLAGRRRETVHCRVEHFREEVLKIRWRHQNQSSCNYFARVLERMNDSAWKINKVAAGCG